jgi:non-specific serine/threonine protein kinase
MAEMMVRVGGLRANREPHNPEVRRTLEEAVALARAAGDVMVEHFALRVSGEHAQMLNEFDHAEALFQESLQLSRETGDIANVFVGSRYLTLLYMGQLQFREALPYSQDAADAARQLNSTVYELEAQCFTAEITRFLGDVPRSIELNEACLAFAREKCEALDQGQPYLQLAKALNDAGEHDRAQAVLDEWIKTLHPLVGHEVGYYAGTLDALACVASGRGDAAWAARLFGADDMICAAMGWTRWLHNDWEYGRYIAKARLALGDAAYEVAYAEGRAMTLEQAVDAALASVGLRNR